MAILIGILLGIYDPALAKQLKPLGDTFIKLIKLVIAPVIFLTVVTGISHMGDMRKVGRVGGKALLYFEIVSTIALAFGMIIVNLLRPGHGASTAGAQIDTVKQFAEQGKSFDMTTFLLNLVPENFIGAFAKGDLIPILIIAILFGAALTRLGEHGKAVEDLLEKVSHVFFGIIGIVMYVAPLGALGAMAYTIGVNGVGVLVNLGELMACVYLTMAAFVIVCLGLIAKFSGFSIFKFLRYITEELLVVLGTSSSETALPRLIDKMERFGVARPVVGLVVPTGYSFNLDGTSIYMSMATIFIAQAYNIDLSITQQIGILAVLMVTSKGAAGVTGSGFITLAATLEATKIVPIEGLALLLGVDRFMSEARAITNIIGNAVAAVVIGKSENAFDTDVALAEYRRFFDDPTLDRI
jgi:aerobic C4-dicarboxylate transport protein